MRTRGDCEGSQWERQTETRERVRKNSSVFLLPSRVRRPGCPFQGALYARKKKHAHASREHEDKIAQSESKNQNQNSLCEQLERARAAGAERFLHPIQSNETRLVRQAKQTTRGERPASELLAATQ